MEAQEEREEEEGREEKMQTYFTSVSFGLLGLNSLSSGLV